MPHAWHIHWCCIWFSSECHFSFLQRTVGCYSWKCWASHIFLASKMSVALSPPSLPRQESINNHSEWQNGFGQWDIRGMHKWINKGAAWRRSPISKCHTQWVSVRPNTVSTQACSKLSNHCHFILTDSPNSSIRKCEKANIEQVILKRRSQTVWCSVQVFTSYLSKSQACPSWNSQTQIVIITT